MKYTLELDINKPRKTVSDLFVDPDNLKKWQPDLIEMVVISGEPGAEGCQTRLTYKMGKRDFTMVETIVKNALPESFSATYETKGVFNRLDNEFIVVDDTTTRWRFTSDFQCSGFLKIMALLMPGMFKKQSRKTMQQFKTFAEQSGVG